MNPPPLQPSLKEQNDSYRNWASLSPDLVRMIIGRLGAIDVLTGAQNICSAWRTICKDPFMWRKIDMHMDNFWNLQGDAEKLCALAVDRSCGGLIDLNLELIGSDSLLEYIADRSNQLKCLRLFCCNDISEKGLSEMATKVPLLEELELSHCMFSKKVLEAVGRSCPLLKSLRLNSQTYSWLHTGCDDDALAIATSMPKLRHLQIFGNKLTNDGLQAILDGCPRLESLDLRQCFNVDLQSPLGRRCEEQVKYLRRPDDSTYDYPLNPETQGYFFSSSNNWNGEIRDLKSSEEGSPYRLVDIGELVCDDDNYSEFSCESDVLV